MSVALCMIRDSEEGSKSFVFGAVQTLEDSIWGNIISNVGLSE